jgi:hypothetical protein
MEFLHPIDPHPAAPQTTADVQALYTQRRTLHQQRYDVLARRHGTLLKAAGACFVVASWFTLHSPHLRDVQALIGAALLALIVFVWQAFRQQTRVAREQRLLVLYDRNLHRADGSETQSGRTGLEPGQKLRTPGHLYDRDFDLLGDNSLFGLLSTVRTGLGERGLARYLLEPATHEESVQRQQSVKELLPQTELRDRIALLGASSFQQVNASFFDQWLADPPPTFHPAWRVALLLTAALNTALILAGIVHSLAWGTVLPNLALTLCIQSAICLYLRSRVVPLLKTTTRFQQHLRLIGDGLALMRSTSFTTPRLIHLQHAALEPANADKLLKSLESHLSIVEQRTKEWFFVPSLLLAAGTQTAISLANWKRTHADQMRTWLAAWGEFEALNALATFAFEHPTESGEHCWPDLLPPTHAPLYEARSLAHPLLPNPIPNDIALGPATRFYLVSGSNMAGKSTLLRSIGINAVLAYAGAPVQAQSLRLTPLALSASLALTDSLAEGRSKFLAEVERLAAIAQLSATRPVLFLVDEIFSGTNSGDRRSAAGAVLDRLLANQAIGALSTHDLALTDLVTPANAGRNVHMASPDPDDPLAFDYKLRPGINTASSARAILRLLGITT